jgi:hypothetical protein
MSDLDQYALSKLAGEMAMNIRPPQAIFADYGIDETAYYEVLKLPFYQRALEQYTLEWNSTLTTKERVSLSSAYILEQVLPIIGARAMSPTEPLAAVNDTAKLLARNAGVGEPKQNNANTADRFIITINLGADVDGKPVVEHYDKSIAPDPGAATLPQLSATSRNFPQEAGQTPEDVGFAALMERN